MIHRNIKGTKSAFSFVIGACNKLSNVHLALDIIYDYIRIGGCSAYMIEDVSILSAGLGEMDVAVQVLDIASSINLDRPISNRVTKKVISKALEFYDGRKMNVSNLTSDEQMKLTTTLVHRGSIYDWNKKEPEIRGDTHTISEEESSPRSHADILLKYLRSRIKDESSPLLLTNSALRIAKKILIENNEDYLAQKLLERSNEDEDQGSQIPVL